LAVLKEDTLRLRRPDPRATAYAVENLNLIKQFFSEALNQMKFEDGYSWSTPLKTSFGVIFSEGKVTIEIKLGR
jgi:hypothetical protein